MRTVQADKILSNFDINQLYRNLIQLKKKIFEAPGKPDQHYFIKAQQLRKLYH